MKQHFKLVGTTLIGVAWTGLLFAGNQTFNFDTDPGSDLSLSGALIVGTHNYANINGFSQLWCSGNPGTSGAGTNGNPSSGGYLSITDGTNNSNNLVFVFPDADSGLPIKGFQIDMDLRVGNGSLGRPADGFSVSFARAGDQVLINATNGVAAGFAGGDGSYAVAQSPTGSTDVENGTKTGVAVVFDAWQGNWLPDTPQSAGTGSSDREGLAVRVDDHTLIQLNLVNNRNWRDCISGGISLMQTNLTDGTNDTVYGASGSAGGPYLGGLSIQTGTNAPILTSASGCPATYGQTDASGSFTNLYWAHLMVRLTNDPNPRLTVTYKGVTLVNTNLTTFGTAIGRLVLAGRTGGNNENTHADNIHVVTTASTNVFLQSITGTGTGNGFIFTLQDNPPATLAGIISVVMDTTNVTPYIQTSYAAPITTGVYTQLVRLAQASFHTVTVTWYDNYMNTNTGSIAFLVPQYVAFPTNLALPLSAVDTTKVGFHVAAYQTFQYNPNRVRWTDEQIMGYRGNNVIGTPSLPSEAGFQVWDGPMDFDNVNGKAPGPGFFPNNQDLLATGIAAGGYPQNAWQDYYDNCALEFFGYIYFPTQGVYTMVMGSDDGFQLSVASNPRDRLGTIIWNNDGSALPGPAGPGPTDFRNVIIDTPGVYPIRLVWENGGGAAGLEWYTYALPSSSPGSGSYLVNDTNNVSLASGAPVILTYRNLSGTVDVGAYVNRLNPVRDAMNVTYYQPIMVELGNGTGSKTVNTGAAITLTTDGVSDTVAVTTPSAGVTRILQTGTPNWSTGFHTNVLTFSDNAAGSYSYTWRFGVMGGATGVNLADSTNTPVAVPLAAKTSGSLSQPGLRIHSHQMQFKHPNTVGTMEEELEGLKGPNIADQSGTNGPGFFTWGGLLDLRMASGTGTGSVGEWAYDYAFSKFGILPQVWNNLNAGVPNNADNCAVEVGCWMVFPSAGKYIFHINSDDGFRIMVPSGGDPFAKSGTELGFFDAGRGIAGNAGTFQGGGTYVPFSIPAAGAYPIRMVYENGGGDGALEWSLFQPMPDGSVAKVAVNDTNTPGYVQCFQVSSQPTGPTVTFMDPPSGAHDVLYYQNHIIKITDGTGATTDPSKIDTLTMDGQALAFNAPTKSGLVTTVVVPPRFGAWNPNQTHTNVLRYHDSASVSYTNSYIWRVQNLSPFGAVQIPASYRVDPASLSQPGVRIRSYQTINPNPLPGGGQNNTMAWTEDQINGLRGPNIASQAGTNGPGFFTWTNVIDFTITKTGGANSGGAEWNYDYEFTNSAQTQFGFVKNPSTATDQSQNDQALEICTWLNFTVAGEYVMTFNSDDSARLVMPYGNPRSRMAAGIHLTSGEVGRGTAGAGFDPRGGMNWCTFHISTPGAYPFRLLWENGGGGGGVEWSIFQPLADGSLAYTLVNDTTTPGTTVTAYQVSTNDTPYVAYIFPQPVDINTNGSAPLLFLTPGEPTPNPINTTQTNDLTIVLSDATTTVNTNTITLSLNGVSQPLQISGSNGLTYITRLAAQQPFWPSGAWGPLILTYTDSSGRTISNPLMYISTAFWGTMANQNPFPLGSGDSNRRGFLLRTYALDTGGTTTIPQRTHVAEQILAGIWTNNFFNPTSTVFGVASNILNPPTGGYFILAGTGAGGSNGLINFVSSGGNSGSFTIGNGYPEQPLPGIPELGSGGATPANRSNNFVCEFLTYIEFPTNGTYILCCNSDDGFRLTRGWGAANNNGALVVNSPASLKGPKATAQSGLVLNLGVGNAASLPLTNPITGTLVLAQGPFSGGNPNNQWGSTNYNGLGYSVDGCQINNAGALNGNIALIYRSGACGLVQKVQQAAAAGARAVVIVQNVPAANGWFPEDLAVSPIQPIPTVMITLNDALPLIAAMATNNPNVTLTPMDYLVNPPAANSPLGQADYGKGGSDIIFPVIVTQPGVYPIRLEQIQGGGGAEVEFYSVYGANRVLINDAFSTNGTALKAYYGLNPGVNPALGYTFDGVNFSTTNTGTLQSNGIIPVTPGTWVDIYNNAPQSLPVIPNGPMRYFQAR